MQKTYQKVFYWFLIVALWCAFGFYCYPSKILQEVGYQAVGLSVIPMLAISLIFQTILIMKGRENKNLHKEYAMYRIINGIFLVLCYSMILFFIWK